MKVVILAAGQGSRLWPLSTPDKPKQFQELIYGQSLLSYTYSNLSKVIDKNDLYVQTLEGLEPHVYEQIPGIDEQHVLLVPERRDTLAETLWTLNILSRETGEPILFKSVDQYNKDADAFLTSLLAAIKHYEDNEPALTLLCTAYQTFSANSGYLTANESGTITSFIEKPTPEEVEELRKDSNLYRSLFIYIASHDTMMANLEKIDSPWVTTGRRLLDATPEERREVFLEMPTTDLSSSLFELSASLKLGIIDDDSNFLDVGRYSALYELNDKDTHGNVIIGSIVTGKDCTNNFIVNLAPQPLVVTSVNNSVIVQTSEGSLVSSIEEADHIGEIYKTGFLQA